MDSHSTETVTVAGAPDIPGLTFRHLRDENDYPGMAAVATAHYRGENVEWFITTEDVAISLQHLQNSDYVLDGLLAEVGGEIVATGRVRWRDETDGPRVHSVSCYVLPEYWDSSVQRAIIRWLEQRAAQNAAGQPTDREQVLETYSLKDAPFNPLLEELGYKVERYFAEMVRPSLDDIPDFPLPDGLEVRPVTPDQYRTIWEADVEAFRDHWGFVEQTETNYERFLANERLFQPELWQVAWDTSTNEIAGQVRTFIDHEENEAVGRLRGYTEEISTRRPYRRRGLARALIARSLRAQREAGMTESALGVDMESLTGATRVYEDCGFVVNKMELLWRKPLTK